MQRPPNENKIKAMIETFFTTGEHKPVSCSSDMTADAPEGKELSGGQGSCYVYTPLLVFSLLAWQAR